MWLRHVAKYFQKVIICGKPDSILLYPNASLVSGKSLDLEYRQSMTRSPSAIFYNLCLTRLVCLGFHDIRSQ